jgi:formylglycine-generating enzyme required for sulfatase activity
MLRIQAFRKVLDERDRFAMELGYPDHFKQVLERNRIGLPTGVDSEKGLSQRVRELESEIVLKAQSAPGPKQVKTLRHLSLNESPFRSCLGGSDCSSNTYLTRALDPNYHYFTLTDEAGLSSGHVTVVLGENSAKAEVARVAFIDKVQNVDSIELPEMIEAVRQSVEEKGYTLALPTKLGDHNGISNEAVTRQFIADQIKTDRSKLITGFSPHAHNYRFPNEFSRAEMRLEMRPVMPLKMAKEVAIKPGKLVQPWKSAEFDLKKLAESTVELKNGSTRDRIRYISSMKTLERAGLKSDPEFQSTLESWIKDEQLPFSLRKQVLITEWMDQHKKLPDLMTEFKGQERINLMQNLLDTPRFRNNVLSRKGDLPELIFHVRENQKLRTQLIREYMPGYETQISKILDAKDLDAYAATAAIKNIQTSLNAVDVDFVMQSKRAVAGSSVEPWVTTASAKAFIINTQGGSQLARGLEKTLQSNVREVKEFGESLVQIGSNPWGHPQPIVEVYRDLSQLQKATGAQNLNEAAGQWLGKSDVPVTKKAVYLKSQMGVGDQRFESLVKSLPSAERKLVLKELKKGTNLDIYQKFAEKHGVESELFDHGVPESFQYQPIITAEEAKKGGVKFVMGEGKDARVVKLTKPFEMQATPMTQLQTVLLTGKNRSNFTGNGFELKINGKTVELDPRRPAEQYDWYDQNEIIRILNENDPNWNYRRPTEAEWEYAARAGSESNYSFGDQQDEMRYHGWSVESSGGKTQPVAQKRPNDFGLYDIHGNVNEWIEDYFAPLTPGKVTDPTGPQNGVTRVIRGGHFDEEPALIGFGNRGGVGAMSKLDHAGFRLVREPK